VLLDAQITHAQPRLLPSTSPPNRRASSPIHNSTFPIPMCFTRGRHPTLNSGSEPLLHLLYLHYSCTCSPHTRTCMHACVRASTRTRRRTRPCTEQRNKHSSSLPEPGLCFPLCPNEWSPRGSTHSYMHECRTNHAQLHVHFCAHWPRVLTIIAATDCDRRPA
jgi:hypothetical protein